MLKEVMFRGIATKMDDMSICVGNYTITCYNPSWKRTVEELDGKEIKILITTEDR